MSFSTVHYENVKLSSAKNLTSSLPPTYE